MTPRKVLANAIRALSMDAVEKANSGHPGMPMGMADIAEVLWNDFLQHNPLNPHWFNRDRFVLSNGHGSMLLYSLLHLTGYKDMTMEQIKNFRQLHSKTPGHPEYGVTPGVETTTGPLGQGIAAAVGMALAEKILASHFNRAQFRIVDHYTYAFLGDGCLMEGLSHECCSLAGHLKLGTLIAFWDDNGISIDGQVAGWFTDDTPKRFEAYDWHVIPNVDGHDPEAIKRAISEAQHVKDRPSLICCKTTIAYGAPKLAGTSKAHGAPLGPAEIADARKELGWSYPPFEIPAEIYQAYDAKKKGQELEHVWQETFKEYKKIHPELAEEFTRRIKGELPSNFSSLMSEFIQKSQEKSEFIATRKSSYLCLNHFAPNLPELIGGSADLTGSNLTQWHDSKAITQRDALGNYIFYGVREFGMFGLMNGLVLHGGIIPFGGTFLTFSDYGRNAIRLAALMKLRVIYVFTHDSIGLGEDGPTHQPIEQATILRITPDLSVWRPCDTVETAVAWQVALQNAHKPTALLLSRQNLHPQQRQPETLANVERGGYILKNCEGTPEVILIATGSEVALAVAAWDYFQKQGHRIRVVSMPSCDVFDQQSTAYHEHVLPVEVTKRVAIEAGSSCYWHRYVGLQGAIIGLDRFGESAPAEILFEYFEFTPEHVIEVVDELLTKN